MQYQLQTLLRGSCGKLPAGNVFLPAPANDMLQMGLFPGPSAQHSTFAHTFQVRLGEFVPLLTALIATFPLVTASLTKPTFWVERCFRGMAWLRKSKFRVSKNVCRPQIGYQSLVFKKHLLEASHDLGFSVEPGL